MENQKLKDFEILKELMNLNIKLSEIDDATKERLIELCREQLSIVNEKIEIARIKRSELEKSLLKKSEE